jgi:thiol reductant ABC exporter CydC subunit
MAAPFKGWMALAALLGFATVGSGVGLLSTSAYIIAKAALRPSIAELQIAIVGVRFFGVARGVLRYLERLVSHQVTFRILARLRVWFYAAVEPLAPARLAQFHSGDLLSRVVADVETLENVFGRAIAPPLVALLTAGLAWLLLAGFDERLALVQVLFLALAGIGVPLLVHRLGRGSGRRLVGARAELSAALVDGVQGAAELLAFGAAERHQARVAVLDREVASLQGRMARLGGLTDALMGLLVNLATLAALVLAVPLVGAGRDGVDGVQLAVLVLVVVASFEAVLPLPQAAQHLEASLAAARRLFEIVDAPPAVVDPPGSRVHRVAELCGATSDPPSPLGTQDDYGLAFQDVRFRYGPGEPWALDGVSLHVAQGQSVAVVGASGAGKTTLLNLLLRFWEYEQGHILLGGRELRDLAQADVRRLVGVVSQHTHLFNATLRENLLLARPGATEVELARAAQQAQLDEFIQGLPQGYDTWIGEQGLRLSGGQRQRLAIARALLKDAPILLLDEPAAHLDAATGRELMRALYALMPGRTTLLITHQLAGLEAVDEIVVLRAGRVVERGRHAELVQMGGLYRCMFNLQRQILADV